MELIRTTRKNAPKKTKTQIFDLQYYKEGPDDGDQFLISIESGNVSYAGRNISEENIDGLEYIGIDALGHRMLYTKDLSECIPAVVSARVRKIMEVDYLEYTDSDGFKRLARTDLSDVTHGYNSYSVEKTPYMNYIKLHRDGFYRLSSMCLKNTTVECVSHSIVVINNTPMLKIFSTFGDTYLCTIDLVNSIYQYSHHNEIEIHDTRYIEVTTLCEDKVLYTLSFDLVYNKVYKNIQGITINGERFIEMELKDGKKELFPIHPHNSILDDYVSIEVGIEDNLVHVTKCNGDVEIYDNLTK